MDKNNQNTIEAIEKNSKEEWHKRLESIPVIREFELNDWKNWAEYHLNIQKENN